MAYTTKQKVENYLMIDIDNSFDSQIELWISAVEAYINKYTGNKNGFETVVGATKYYDGNGERELVIDPFVSITSVEILEVNSGDVAYSLTEGEGSDYITYPYNETIKYKLILTISASIGAWYSGNKRVKVVGRFGYGESLPKDIELAATMLVGNIIAKGQRGGNVSSEKLGDYAVSFANIDEDSKELGIKKILDSYKIFKL